MRTVRLTVGQASARFLAAQAVERDGRRHPFRALLRTRGRDGPVPAAARRHRYETARSTGGTARMRQRLDLR